MSRQKYKYNQHLKFNIISKSYPEKFYVLNGIQYNIYVFNISQKMISLIKVVMYSIQSY